MDVRALVNATTAPALSFIAGICCGWLWCDTFIPQSSKELNAALDKITELQKELERANEAITHAVISLIDSGQKRIAAEAQAETLVMCLNRKKRKKK